MLFILTGDVQIGKTRWLSCLCATLAENQISCWGVLAPGVWQRSCVEGSIHRDKQGIDAILLPQYQRMHFARRRDLLSVSPDHTTRQSDDAQLKWAIDDDSLVAINRHFDIIEQGVVKVREGISTEDLSTTHALFSGRTMTRRGLLVVDELGRLELVHDQGLTSAVMLLEQGPTLLYQHALVIVRDVLIDDARQRFSSSWEQIKVIAPDDKAFDDLRDLYDIA